MSAHSAVGEGPAHDSNPPMGSTGKMKYLNVDSTGFSMSWRTGVSVIVAIVTLMLLWTAFATTLAKKSDVTAHDVDSQAHKVMLEGKQKPEPIVAVVERHEQEFVGLKATIGEVKKEVRENKDQTVELKETVVVGQAEQLADRAADKLQTRDPDRKLRQWRRVKSQALQNVKEKKPMRDGLEELL